MLTMDTFRKKKKKELVVKEMAWGTRTHIDHAEDKSSILVTHIGKIIKCSYSNSQVSRTHEHRPTQRLNTYT